MDDEFDDLEDTAAAVANAAYLKVMLRKTARLAGLLAVTAAVIAADWVAGIRAALLLPLPAGVPVGVFTGIDFSLAIWEYRKNRTARRSADAALDDGERMLAQLDRLRADAPPPWQAGLRSRRFWTWLAARAVYGTAAGTVLAYLAGPGTAVWVPVTAAVAYTALEVAVRARGSHVIAIWASAAAFTDVTRPRDTPEI